MMKATSDDFIKAIFVMREIIPFFPKGDGGMAMVKHSLEKYVSTVEQLDWLVDTACDRMREFKLPELRGIFCSRFPPADGVYMPAVETATCSPEDGERAYHEREARETDRRLAEWRREAKLLGETHARFELEGEISPLMKEMPAEPEKKQEEPVRRSLREREQEFAAELAEAQKRSDDEKARLIEELERALKSEKPTP